jgi:hypothetical protein
VRNPERLGPWLYGVARRVAREARVRGGRPQRAQELAGRESQLLADEEGPDCESIRREEFRTLHEELGRLPAKYLEPIVLCYFEGLTHDEAACRLGWPVGTVSVRLRRARKILEARLTRRGLAPAAATLMLASGTEAEAKAGVVSASLAEPTLRAAFSHPTATLGVPSSSTPVALIAGGVIRTMFWYRIRTLAIAWLAVGLVATGSTVAFYHGQGAIQSTPEATKQGPGARPEDQASPAPVHISPESPPALSDRTQARIIIGSQIRDHYFRLYQAGEVDLDTYLRWQMRYTDLIESEVGRPLKDFDPVILLQTSLQGFQRLEKIIKERVEKGQSPRIDAQVVEFYRLEIEEKLERAKAKGRPTTSPGEAGKSSPPRGPIPPPTPPLPPVTVPRR